MKFFSLLLLVFILSSCQKDNENTVELSGGDTTIFSAGPDSYTFPLANLDAAGNEKHFAADGVFGQQFVTAPANQAGGIGPLFNQNSCESCHIRNGRGTVPQMENDPNTGLLLRISMSNTINDGRLLPVPGFGLQLQHKAIFGSQAEGILTRSEVQSIVTFIDGTKRTISKHTYGITNPYISLASDVLISPRNAPPVYGLGLLESISESDITAYEDEFDMNSDNISGRKNIVFDVLKNKPSMGRFGWKAEQPTAGQQAADAAHNDMGLTNHYFPVEHCDGQENCINGRQSTLDIDDETVDLLAYYFQTLAPPAARNQNSKEIQDGKKIFIDIKCGSCHVPSWTTSTHPIAQLSNQKIYPYTDLLLHDMGEELSDRRPVARATGNEWRTPPLWGIGLTKVVNPKATFLHDGRAKSIEEAILWHGGEGEQSTLAYTKLNSTQRAALIKFLESL
jgi:CxxC motif-containing protein (DUF1111 family)